MYELLKAHVESHTESLYAEWKGFISFNSVYSYSVTSGSLISCSPIGGA